MGIFSKFERRVEDGVEGAASRLEKSALTPVQITKKAEKEMKREKMAAEGKVIAPTLFTVLVSVEDDKRLFGYYPTLAGEVETYLIASANESGYAMDGRPLVRFIADPDLKRGKFDVIAELVAAPTVARLREDENKRYGLSVGSSNKPAGINNPKNNPSSNAFQSAQTSVPVANVSHPNLNVAPQSAPVAKSGISQSGIPQVVEPVKQNAPEPENAEHAPELQRVSAEPDINHMQYPVNQVRDANRFSNEQLNVASTGAPNEGVDEFFAPTPVNVDAVADPQASVPSAESMQAPHQEKTSVMQGTVTPVPQPKVTGVGDVYLYDEGNDAAYKLTGLPQKIGRESKNDIVVSDINASRVHAEIHMEPNGTWVISDLNSTNGLYVNGRRVKCAPLQDADIVLIGTTRLEFQLL